MGLIRDTAAAVWRAFNTDGVPATGVHEPVKSEIIALMGNVEDAVVATELAGAVEVKYATKALMDADTSQADGTLALVLLDSTTANNGYWVWDDGGSQWVRSPMLDPADVIADAQAEAVAAVEAEGESQIASILSLSVIDTLSPLAGYEEGWVFCDANGWADPQDYVHRTGLVGSVVRIKIPGADFSGLAGAIRIAEPALPSDFLFAHDARQGDGFYVPNIVTGSPTAFGGNIFGFPTGDIRNASGSQSAPAITKFYATGPGGNTTAARVLYGSTGATFSLINAGTTAPGTTPPAGTYYARLMAKSNTGSSQAARIGCALTPTDETNITITTSWQQFTFTFTSDGTNYSTVALRGDGSNLLDILVDEIEIKTVALAPTFSDVRDWAIRRRAALPGGLLYDADGALDNVTNNGTARAGGYSIIAGPKMTTAVDGSDGQLVEEYTYFVTFKQTTAGNVAVIASTETDAALPLPANTLSIGVAADGTLNTQPVSMAGALDFVVTGKGYMTIMMRVKPGERACNLNDVIIRWGNTASFTPREIRHFLLGGSANTTQLIGSIVADGFVNRYITEDEVIEVNNWIRYNFTGAVAPTVFPEWIFGIGDSRTAAAAPSGDSYFDLQGIGNLFQGGTKQALVRNCAQSGYGAANILAMLTANNPTAGLPVGPGGLVQRIAEAAAGGSPSIVVYGPCGVNNNATVIADPAAYFTASVLPIWQTVKATGSKLVVCTELNAAGIAGWDTARQALNDIMRANSSEYDALADIGALDLGYHNDGGIGDANAFWNDDLHNTQAGHDYMAPTLTAALATLGV
ncbi:MAG: SGNH/GDSL hydrolase family protein [Caulobacter sp.]|nr:SGNH/GDSL hydrolase family protein [Caulobacter sp.]